jgi:hypothetical protein
MKYWREEYPTNGKKKADWIGDMLSGNCLLKHVTQWKIEESIEMMRKLGRRYKQVLDDLTENLWNRKLKEEALERLALEEAMELSSDKLRNERWPRTWYMHTTYLASYKYFLTKSS